MSAEIKSPIRFRVSPANPNVTVYIVARTLPFQIFTLNTDINGLTDSVQLKLSQSYILIAESDYQFGSSNMLMQIPPELIGQLVEFTVNTKHYPQGLQHIEGRLIIETTHVLLAQLIALIQNTIIAALAGFAGVRVLNFTVEDRFLIVRYEALSASPIAMGASTISIIRTILAVAAIIAVVSTLAFVVDSITPKPFTPEVPGKCPSGYVWDAAKQQCIPLKKDPGEVVTDIMKVVPWVAGAAVAVAVVGLFKK